MVYVGELGVNYGVEVFIDVLCCDIKSGMIDMLLDGVNDMVLFCIEEGSFSGSIMLVENNNNFLLLLDVGGFSGSINFVENNNIVLLLLDVGIGFFENILMDDEFIFNDIKVLEII